MSEVGLSATELGPDGFLPADPEALAKTLADHNLHAVGGFTPFVLHRPDVDPLIELDRLLPGFKAARAGVMVLSADSGMTGYDSRPDLDAEGWQRLLRNLDRVAGGAAAIVGPPRGIVYDGWYTLEQDTILTEPPAGEGPVADVRISVDYLRSLLTT
jgi:sugar phosphate isomerase/epimerase